MRVRAEKKNLLNRCILVHSEYLHTSSAPSSSPPISSPFPSLSLSSLLITAVKANAAARRETQQRQTDHKALLLPLLHLSPLVSGPLRRSIIREGVEWTCWQRSSSVWGCAEGVAVRWWSWWMEDVMLVVLNHNHSERKGNNRDATFFCLLAILLWSKLERNWQFAVCCREKSRANVRQLRPSFPQKEQTFLCCREYLKSINNTPWSREKYVSNEHSATSKAAAQHVHTFYSDVTTKQTWSKY